MRSREWTIRTRIFALLVIPIASSIVLWILATSFTVGPASDLLSTRVGYEEAAKPTYALIEELRRERRLALLGISTATVDPVAAKTQRERTDAEVNRFRGHAERRGPRDVSPAETLRRVDEFASALGRLPAIRGAVDGRQLDHVSALGAYTAIIDQGYRVYMALPGIDENSVSRDARTVIALTRARESLSQEDALLGGAAATGRFSEREPGELTKIIGVRRLLVSDAVVELPTSDQEAYHQILRSPAGLNLLAMEDTLAARAEAGAPVPVDMTAWRDTYSALDQRLRDAERTAGEGVVARGRSAGVSILIRLALAAGLGLIAIVASIVVSIRVGRSFTRRLIGLERAANEFASERLPSLVSRVRNGETVDLASAAPPLEFGSDEIGRVGKAFGAARRTAVESALREARLRSGMNEVFLNIARRGQAMLHRQLKLLDAMERRTVDPERLDELFQVDHLATRMRRYTEDLVILAGSVPGRGWRGPILAVDVVRGAVSEIEEYQRVTTRSVPSVAVAGPAVGDLIHLLAELIENATRFSSPHTRVTVGARTLPPGLAIEIEDHGSGMTPAALSEANERLTRPPTFDPELSARLGLFVVATLAARHGVEVALRRSPHGGVTAIALVPTDLIVQEPDQAENGGLTGRPGVSPAAPSGPEPAAGEPEPSPSNEVNDLTALPRRRKQESLAPELRDDPRASAGDPRGRRAPLGDGERDASRARSPERVRSTMSALQAGLLRARRDSGEAAD